MAGINDVQDGLSGGASAMLMKSYASAGKSLTDLLRNVQAQEHIPVIDDVITSVPDITAAILDLIGVSIESECCGVEGVVYVYVGVGVSAGLFLGWLDTNGYRMVGVQGKVRVEARPCQLESH
jgi:hypothetical protein